MPVLNGGVFAYGVDQAFLRATILLEAHNPTWVVFAFIKDDVNRTQFSYYSAWKPYYEFDRGELLLLNSPVPRVPAPKPRLAWLRTALGHSLLASALARRYADGWWYYGTILRQHSAGVAVATELVRACGKWYKRRTPGSWCWRFRQAVLSAIMRECP